MKSLFSTSLFFSLLLSFSLHASDISNPLDGSLQEGGAAGNSEVKYYSGDLGLFVRLPRYRAFDEDEVLGLTYRSQTADPLATVLDERNFHRPFTELEVSTRFNGGKSLLQRYKGLKSPDESKPGYLFKAHFPARDLSTGFYPADVTFTYTYFEGLCRICTKLPWIGSYFGQEKRSVESFQKRQFVLNSIDSPYGAGWYFSRDER